MSSLRSPDTGCEIMSGSAVYITGRLGVPFLQRIKALLPDAINRAIYNTKQELENTVLKNPSIVPKDTGRLQNQVVSFVSPGQITFQWSAVDPRTGFNYAKLRDDIGGKIAPANFSGRILAIAKELLRKYLLDELGAMQP